MKMFGRQDLLLVAALATALVLLTAAFFFHKYRRNHLQRAMAQAAELATRAAEHRAEELERLVAFGQALGRAVEFEAIRVAVSQHLPAIAGTDKVWVLVQQGSEWLALTGDTRGAEDILPWDDLAEQLLASGPTNSTDGADAKTPRDPERAMGFPLLVGGSVIGVLGVRPSGGALPADRRRIIEAAAALLAVSVSNAQLFRELKEHSVKDALTGCFTRSHSLDVIDAEWRRARRSQTPVSLIMFDLDHFKDVTDRYGHLCSDAVLSAVGKRMKEVLRGSELKCRYGGERFLVLLPETPLHGARRVAETLRREIAERPVPWSGEGLTITASFGLAQTIPGEVNAQAVIARADQALYRAKDDGRNCVRIAPEIATLVADETNRHNRVT